MRNPIRRSRNIGRTQGGRVKVGAAIEKSSRHWAAGDKYFELSKTEGTIQLFRDNPSKTYYHPCDPEEYLRVLKLLPDHLSRHLKAIILPRLSKSDEAYGVNAKRIADCIIINPFPKSREIVWYSSPEKRVRRHNAAWCAAPIIRKGRVWVQRWQAEEIRRYCLFHLFLHELGHVNQPWFHSLARREEFAENFALEWAVKLGAMRDPRVPGIKFTPRAVGSEAGYLWS